MMSARLRQGPARPLSVAALVLVVALLLLLQAGRPSPAAAAGPQPAPTPSGTPARPAPTPTGTPSSDVKPTPSAPSSAPAAQPSPTTSTSTSSAALTSAQAAAAAPVLAVTVASSPASIARAGQTVSYTVTVKNTGNGALRALAVSAVAPNLPTLTCAPVAQGATLYTSTTTTCTAKRTSSAADLLTDGQSVSATAAGLASNGTAVTATAHLRTTVTTLAPKVTDDSVTVLANTASVVLAGSTNDTPGEVGGPAIDGARTELTTATGTGTATKAKVVPHGTFQVLANGSVRYVVDLANGPWLFGWTESVSYRTYDATGRSTIGTATVVVPRPPVANDDNISVGQGQAGSVIPLANDVPGQKLDGTGSSFDPSTLRFTAHQSGPGTVSPSGDSVTLPNAGVFTLAGGRATFTPDPRNVLPVGVTYSVTDRTGITVTGAIQVHVDAADPDGPADPVVTHDVAFTTYQTPVQLPGALNDAPGAPGHTVSFGGFVDRDHVGNRGLTLTVPQGTWSIAPDGADPAHGPVRFSPAAGFSGTIIQYYLAQDSAGGETVSALTVTVQPGPLARPDTLATRLGTDGSTNPAANDTPGLRVDGSASTFDPRWAVFPSAGQPAGSVVADQGKTLTLPGKGKLWFANGTVVLRPQPGFHGFVGTVAYQLEDTSHGAGQRGTPVVGHLTALVTSDALTATDDSATTAYNRPVTLPAAINDDPGTTTTALRPVFPAAGQPSGSVRAANGLTLTVPGQGTWVATTTAGSVTFTPVAKYVGTTTPVTYQIAGAGGATATARLQATVEPGAAAAPDVLTRPEDNLSVDPLLNDFPGRSANGRLGTLELSSVRFPADGQPAGATLGEGGRSVFVPAHGTVPGFHVDASPEIGVIGYTLDASYHGTLPPIAYAVLSDVTDSTGTVNRLYTRSTVQLTVTGGAIVTTDDHVTVRSGVTANLPGASNDSPAPGFFPFDFDEMGFAALAQQPPGSTIVDDSHGHDHEYSLVVPDEGVWRISGGGFMSFKPDVGFVGDTSPVRYTIFDFAFLHFATGTETVTVLPPAIPRADTATSKQGVTVVVHPLANDTPELDPNGHPYNDAAAKVTFDPARRPSGSTLTPGSGNKQLVVPGQGTYTIAYGTGDVTFVPDPTFRGTATAFYLLVPGGSSRFQVTVSAVTPVAAADSATTTSGTSVRVNVLANDKPGTTERPLVPQSVQLTPDLFATPTPTTSADGQTLTIPGRGVFAVAGDGSVTFYPVAGVTGLAVVGYNVADANGTKAYSNLSVRVA